ncbi:hypothetical protein [Thalassobellus suaedae]|uniref:Phage abortive infection protein n=1 Tax=Thalassobellus suaedae TaxID=3074124 RepID=A0ABY9XXL8_9FLAO|nr:hypothetical protein RHP51_07800 [Flavobacteriaceae bacterium HL-DH14]
MKNEESLEKSIYQLGVKMSLLFITLAIIGFLILLLPLLVEKYNYSNLGSLGDTVGGFLNPLIAISAALLTFLAFYIQYQANTQVQNQFSQQQFDDLSNFEYSKLKERIHLIIKEIDNFSVAFHEGKLITKLNETEIRNGKKYNFNGVQGLNLFLIEYFRDMKEKEKNKIKEFNFDDSYHSVALGINNLIVLFYNTHLNVKNSFLSDKYKEDLIELLTYVYLSKVSFLVHHFYENSNRSDKLFKMIEALHHAYNKQPKSD